MDDHGSRLWSRVLQDAMQNSSEFSEALEKEKQLFRALAMKGELGERVTVMCCGDGREVESLLDVHREFPQITELNAVDLLSISIDQVQEKIRGRMKALDGVYVRLLQEDATNTSIAPGSQDTVTCMLTMVNFNDAFIEKFRAHVQHILKPGGKFIFSVYNHDAFDARMKLYTKMEAPIETVDPHSGLVVFEEGFNEAAFSRQFKEEEIRKLLEASGLDVRLCDAKGITHMGIAEKAMVQRKHEDIPASYQMAIAASILVLIGGCFYADYQKIQRDNAADPDSKVIEAGPGIYMRVNWKKGTVKRL